MYCLNVGCADCVGDGQHLLPFFMLGDELVAVGAILYEFERVLTGSLRVQGFACCFESFRRVVLKKG